MKPIDRAREELRARAGGGAVRVDLSGPVARVVLNHPQAANALTGTMIIELEGALDAIERALAEQRWDGVGLLLRGAGERAFCAGSDLRLVRANLARPELAREMALFMHALTERLAGLPLISVAAIEGAAVGGGAELATACDHRVISRRGFIRFVHARLGLSPGWGGGARLVRLLGRQRALRMLAGSERVSAARALDWGLVDRLAAPGQTEARASALLSLYARGAPASVRAAKSLVAAAERLPFAEAHAEEAALFEELWGGPAQQAALSRSGKGR